MKHKLLNYLLVGALLAAIILLSRLPATLAWWVFVIPVFLFGATLSWFRNDVPGFKTGFVTGFMVWGLGNLYYDLNNGGLIFDRFAAVLSVNKMLILLLSGVMGGLLTGLAFYAGKKVFSGKFSDMTL